MTGYPTSGKTHRAKQLVDYFESRIRSDDAPGPPPPPRVHHITDARLHIARSAYDLRGGGGGGGARSANAAEKDARAAVLAAAKRALGPRDVVVLDAAAGNYIKGWRYQLWCEAKAARSTCCVVRVGTAVEAARAVNERRLERVRQGGANDDDDDERPYEPAVWENLVFRYEEPSGMARWDRPLFTVLWDDAAPPCAAIWDALMGTAEPGGAKAVAVKPHQATVLKPAAAEGYLHELDRVTRDVVDKVVQWARDNADDTGAVDVSPADPAEAAQPDEQLLVHLPAAGAVGLPALQRLRRQFITMNRLEALPAARTRASFVRYLNDAFETTA